MLRTLINQRLGRYMIAELLGRGGMAAVYRATDTVLQRDVALKILYPQYGDDQSLVERFSREAITAAALEHPHIVPVYDVGEHDGMAYIAMKLLSGETLQDRLLRAGAISPDALCQILRPVADALDYAHSRGVIHRDIKPGNIFLIQTASGPPQVMLTDFGIAKRLDAPGLTTTGALIGTPDYMAPEQIAGKQVDARTDVYALGMLAYRALTGRRAFEGSTQDVLMGHLYSQPPPPSSVAPDLPSSLDPVLLRAVASDATARFPSASAFVQAIDAARGAQAIVVGRPPALPPIVHAPATPLPTINSAPTMVNPAIQIAQTQPPSLAPVQSTGTRSATTHTTIASAGRQPAQADSRGSAAPWILAIILALVAGGLAVALGFLVGSRQGSSVAGVGLAGATATTSPTPSITAVPTLEDTATPDRTEGAVGVPPVEPEPSTPTAEPPSPTLGQPLAPPAPSATAESIVITSPTGTATPSPTATVEPTATASPTPTADCTEGMLQGGFGQLYRENVSVRSKLGCPQAGERAGDGSVQFFVGGTMVYWGLNPTSLRDTIIVLLGLDGGTYTLVTDTEAAGYPEPPPSEDPNAPVRGFGRIYFGRPGVASAMGAWKSPEIELKGEDQGVIQLFDGGTMIYTPIYKQPGAGAQAIFVLYADGSFERYNDQPVR
ncbi:protein kinase [Chloroflexales bacterium ZM16-3]|nr:protein kinase [Chloroflexales bacterium ZM16-3]